VDGQVASNALYIMLGDMLVPQSTNDYYTPAVGTDWTGADPTTIAEAIDRIAAALGPIA